MEVIVDRFEGPWAVVEYRTFTFNLPREVLPGNVREGDVLKVTFEVDSITTKSRRNRIQKLEDDLFR